MLGDLNHSGFSPGRTTTVTVDVPDYALVQAPWWKSLDFGAITGKADNPQTANVHMIPGIGWRLTTYHDVMEIVHEQNMAAPAHLDMSTSLANNRSGILKAVSTLKGVAGHTTEVAGDYHNQQDYKAGDDVSATWPATPPYNLNSTDGAVRGGFPPPPDPIIVPVDRKFQDGSGAMSPDQTLIARFWVPSPPGGTSLGLLLRIYFTGLAASPKGGVPGNGQYCLSLFGDGIALLWEKGIDGTWYSRKSFKWCPPHQVCGHWHWLGIGSDAWFSDGVGGDGNWHGSVIKFTNQSVQDHAVSFSDFITALAEGANAADYAVPQTISPQNISPACVRLDERRNLRSIISLNYTFYHTFGTLQSAVFENPHFMGPIGGTDPPIFVHALGSFPSGTQFDISLMGADGTPCTPLGATQIESTLAYRSFKRIDGQQEYYVLLQFGSDSNQKLTPTVRSMDFVREGINSVPRQPTPFELPPGSVTDYSIMGPGKDPTIERGSIGIMSMQDGFTVAANGVADPLAALTSRSGQSVRIEANIPPTTVNGHVTSKSTLMIAKMGTLRRKRIGGKRYLQMLRAGSGLAAFPSHTWWQGKAMLLGLWKRLMQAKTTQTYPFGKIDTDTGQIYSVTKVVRTLLSNAGLPPNMLSIREIPILLLTDQNDKAAAYQVEVYTEALPYCLELVKDYLGAAIVIDANATNGGGGLDKFGCVHLKLPPRPDANGRYPPLCQFVDDATWSDGVIREKLNLNSYPPYVRLDNAQVPTVPIFGWTMEDWDEPPEGNWVYVTGSLAVGETGGFWQELLAAAKLWAKICNWPAANFGDNQPIACDPTHPDFTDGSPNLVLVIDPALNTQTAVNFAARRIFDFACHRRRYKRFAAPAVLVIDPDDPLQIRPRPLTWGDCVIYNGEYWFISNFTLDVNGERGGTKNSEGIYEVFQIPELQAVNDENESVYHDLRQHYGPIAGGVS